MYSIIHHFLEDISKPNYLNDVIVMLSSDPHRYPPLNIILGTRIPQILQYNEAVVTMVLSMSWPPAPTPPPPRNYTKFSFEMPSQYINAHYYTDITEIRVCY